MVVRMKELVEVIAKALVDNPEEVVVTEKGEGKNITIELHVAADDMGRPPEKVSPSTWCSPTTKSTTHRCGRTH